MACLLVALPAFACKPLMPNASRDAKRDASTAEMAFIGNVTSVKASKENPIVRGGDFIVNRFRITVQSVASLKGQAPASLNFYAYTGCGSTVPDVNERVVVFSRGGEIQSHSAGEHYEQFFRAALKGPR